jgi:hypothetical protein
MPENTIPTTPFSIPPVPVPPKPRKRFLRWFLLSLGAILFLLIAAFFGFLQYAEQRAFSGLTPEQTARFERWYNEKVTIPPEALRVEPFTSQTLEAARAFERLWGESGKTATELGDAWYTEKTELRSKPISTTATLSLQKWRDRLTPFEPLMAAWRDVVRQPDYRMEVWYISQLLSPNDCFLTNTLDSLTSAQRTGRLVYLQTLIQIEENRFEGALEGADALIAFTRMSPYPTMVQRGLASVLLDYGLDAYVRISANLTDPALRARARQNLQRYRDHDFFCPEPELDSLIADPVAMTWKIRYQGLIPDFENKTGWEIVGESLRVQQVFLEEYIRPRAKTSEEQLKVADCAKMLSAQRQFAQKYSSVWDWLSFGRAHRVNMVTNCSVMFPSIEKMSKRETGFRRQYDLLLEDLKGNTLPDTGNTPDLATRAGESQSPDTEE